jgi:hypothetical protein
LFVAGVEEELANFNQVSHHKDNIAGKIRGNFDVDAVYPLAESAWNMMKDKVKLLQTELLIRLEDELGYDLATDGIKAVWRAAKEGRGHTLIVERDFQVTGYVQEADPNYLFLAQPAGDYDVRREAVEDIIRTVLEKGGQVRIVENGDLKKHDQIAMLLRY